MVAIQMSTPDPTLEAMERAIEDREAADNRARPYLGMSAIGGSCERKLWYSFRWAARERMKAKSLMAINDGHRSEDIMADMLRLVPGVKLDSVDPRTGEQWAFEDLAGHFRGHADGMITGILQAPKTVHVWEAKACNEAKQAKLQKLKDEKGEKQALREWDPVYYAQAVLYMAYSYTTRHYLTCSSPGVRSIVSVRTETDLDEARKLRQKAERIITSDKPLSRVSENPSWYECGWCTMADICHRQALPAVNCRTCAHSTPLMDREGGQWSCALHDVLIDTETQRHGCVHHLFNPAFVPGEAVDADEDANWIAYQLADGRKIRNGSPAADVIPSKELADFIARTPETPAEAPPPAPTAFARPAGFAR